MIGEQEVENTCELNWQISGELLNLRWWLYVNVYVYIYNLQKVEEVEE